MNYYDINKYLFNELVGKLLKLNGNGVLNICYKLIWISQPDMQWLWFDYTYFRNMYKCLINGYVAWIPAIVNDQWWYFLSALFTRDFSLKTNIILIINIICISAFFKLRVKTRNEVVKQNVRDPKKIIHEFIETVFNFFNYR